MELPLAALVAGATGWRDGHAAVASGMLATAQLASEDELSEAVQAYAAVQARAYMREQASALELTPREAVVLFRTYFRAYGNGVLDEAAQRATG